MKIVITELEMYGSPIERHWQRKDKEVRRLLNPREVLMHLASARAGVEDNLLWHGWKHYYLPEKKEWVFVNQ